MKIQIQTQIIIKMDSSARITDVCKIVCTALVSQLWGHNNKVAHSIQHKPPAGQPTLQNTLRIKNMHFQDFQVSAAKLQCCRACGLYFLDATEF